MTEASKRDDFRRFSVEKKIRAIWWIRNSIVLNPAITGKDHDYRRARTSILFRFVLGIHTGNARAETL